MRHSKIVFLMLVILFLLGYKGLSFTNTKTNAIFKILKKEICIPGGPANAGIDQNICGSLTTTLAGNNPAPGTGLWTQIGGTGISFANATLFNTSITSSAYGSFTLRWTVTDGGITFDDVAINFYQTPTTANAGLDQTGASMCGLTSTTLSANAPVVGTGLWSIISGTGGAIAAPGSPISTFNGTAGTTYVLRWTISNGSCTASIDDVTIMFHQNPTTANAGLDQIGASMCGLTSTTLSANTPIVGTGLWTIFSGIGGTITTPTSPSSNFSGTAGTTYVLRWTISNGLCTSIDDVTVTFQRNPTVSNAGMDQTGVLMCGLTITTLAANTPTFGTGLWSIISGIGGTVTTPVSPTSTFSGTAGTTYVLRWTISNSPCTASTDDVTITFQLGPTTANAGPDQTGATTCGLTSTTLSANTPITGTGIWSIVSGTGGIIATPGSPISAFSGTAGMTYILRWTISNNPCPASTDDVTIKFNLKPTLVITNPAAVCSPSTINLTAPEITAGSTPGLIFTYWTDAAATILYPTPATAGAGTYYIKGTTVEGCFDIKPVIVTVNASAIATASINGPACTGTLLSLTGGPAGMTAYSWTGPNGFTSALQSPVVSTSATIAMTGVYTLRVTNSNSCQDTATTKVVVTVIPTANAGSGGSECDLNFIFNAVPSVGIGTWTIASGPGTASYSPSANSPTATVTVSAYGTYTFNWTELNGTCSNSSPVTVNFYQQPAANAGTGGNECDLIYTLKAVSSVGIGTWTKTTGPGNATFTPNANTPNATVTVSAYGTYTFTWSEVNGPCSNSSTITVNFYQQPVANAGTGGNNCGQEFNLKAAPSVGTGTWTKVSGPGNTTFSPNANTPTAKVTVSAYGTYSLRWTEVNGTCSNSATVSITFILQPTANGGIGGNECDKDFILSAVPGSVPGTWTKISGPGNATFSPNATTPNAKVTVTLLGAYDFAWTEVNSQCTSTDIVRVTFHDLPSIDAGADVPVCQGGSIQLHAVGTGSFVWSPGNLLNNPNISNPVASPVITSVFTVTLTDQYVCKNSDQVTVEVRKRPVANAGPNQVLEYLFETNFEAVLNNSYETGEWTILSGEGVIDDINNPVSLVSELTLEDNIFIWTVTNGACPTSTDTVNIIVHDLVIPTLITPNLDGKNDFFKIQGVETLGKTELIIFNRWGAQVYKNSNYDNKWDGVDDNADPLPGDTYFFILKPEKSKSIRGYVVIRR